jgi:hypothetical protein
MLSLWQQKLYGNDQGQMANLRDTTVRKGATVVAAPTAHVGPGWDPGWLVRAAALARRHGAVLVAETTDRFIRSTAYSKTNQDA